MRDNRHHTNPWADRLSQVSLPDGDAAWKGMELLLDKQMPVRKDRLRWILLILLLLLLIGVCNCPGRPGNRASHGGDDQVARVSSGPDAATVGGAGKHGGGQRDRGGVEPAGNTTTSDANQIKGPADRGVTTGVSGHARPRVSGGGVPASPGDTTAADHRLAGSPDQGIPSGSEEIVSQSERITAGGSHSKVHKPKKGKGSFLSKTKVVTANNTQRPGANQTQAEKNDAELPDQERATTTPGPEKIATTPEQERGATTPGSEKTTTTPAPGKTSTPQPAKKDSASTQKKKVKPPPAEDQKKQRANGWTIGIGLNQFFTIGGQQASHYNSGGISGTLGDYIPVPMIRYHFNRKFFIQLEAQFNSPQYTGKNLLISLPPLDSLSPTVRRQSSVLIKKLFYFNVPLSVHYRVFKNLDVGAGIQFSRLSNGIGLFQDRTINIGPGGAPDSLSAVSKSFKGDTLYKKIKTTELRALLDASYTQSKFIFGVRYNQALSQFIHVQLAPGQITQARNSSLQIYLRYVLWDNQKKPPYLTK